MRGKALPVLRDGAAAAGSYPASPASSRAGGLSILSVHFESGRCPVRCAFCYLGQRVGASDRSAAAAAALDLDVDQAEAALRRLDYRELAVTLSEPIEPVLPALLRLLRAAAGRGKPVAVTTTVAVIDTLCRQSAAPTASDSPVPELLAAVGRWNISIDPLKGQLAAPVGRVEPADIAALLSRLRHCSPAERVLIVTLSSPRFADELIGGLLARLIDLPDVDRLALNALKPPPAWCDRAFWLRALARLAPLLRQHLDRRLFLDCYVAARILGLGPCPGRADLSPAPSGGLAFRSCVYQPAADFIADSSDDLDARLRSFAVPAVCPFPID